MAVALWLFACVLAALPLAGRAQDDDLPGRVGRVAEFAGQLLLSPQDRADEWEPVGINYPISSGINLWVSSDGRAEIDYGGGQFRLAGGTHLHVARLDDRELALFIAQGRVILRVRVQDAGEATRIDTPSAQVTLMRPGLYRVDVAPDGQTTSLVVREGEASVGVSNESRQVLAGQAVSVGADTAIAEVRTAQAADGFDTWSANRDRRYERPRSYAYVSRQMVGAADLDRYGAWQATQEYGAVWFPNVVAPNWAPYRDGYWADIGGWGPTWVDSAPWGYAPFHYGRWAFISGRWGWCPGGYVARPVWAPALVAWYGGSGWGQALTNGRPLYGWVPLGWREPYQPRWRRCSSNCWARFNEPHGVDVKVRPSGQETRHVNLAVPGALSAVPSTALGGRTPVKSNLVNVPSHLASSAPPMRTMPSVGFEQRQVPRVTPGMHGVPGAATTVAPRWTLPVEIPPHRQSTEVPQQRQPAQIPPQRQPVRTAPSPSPNPATPSPSANLAPPSMVTSPATLAPTRVAPPAPTFPAQGAPGQNGPAVSGAAKGGRSVGERSGPEAPPAGATMVR